MVASGVSEATQVISRHAFRSGMDLTTLQLMVGHAGLNVLNRYLALAGEDLQRSHSQRDPLDYVMDS